MPICGKPVEVTTSPSGRAKIRLTRPRRLASKPLSFKIDHNLVLLSSTVSHRRNCGANRVMTAINLLRSRAWIGLLVCCAVRPAPGQQIRQLRDRPFTAIAVERSGGRIASNLMGRSVNGSWFTDKANSQGVLEWRLIKDVANRQVIELNFVTRRYIVHHLPVPEINFKTYSISEWITEQGLIEAQWIRTGQALGHRVADGVSLVGSTTTSGSERTDRWDAVDLGATFSYEAFSSGTQQTTWRMTDIHDGDPNPSLFTIPEGFEPAIVRGLAPQ